jgi:predicted TPR repeat methyltransferase
MLRQAENSGLYKHLHHQEIIEFLMRSNELFDLIVCADVLPYVGDLEVFMAELSRHLAKNGYGVFSIESCENYPFELQTTARFTHHPQYISQLLNKVELDVINEESVTLRFQEEVPVKGCLYVVKKKEATQLRLK